MSSLRCDHCLGDINPSQVIYDEINGSHKIFCCEGCRTIYSIIHEHGLDEFYQKRKGWIPGRFESKEVNAEHFRNLIMTLSDDESQIEFIISNIRCASCIWLIEHFLKKKNGITYVRVNYATHMAVIRWNPQKISLEKVLKNVTSLGYLPRPFIKHGVEDELKKEKNDLLIRFGTASFFSMQLMIYSIALYAGYFQGIEIYYKKIFQFIAWALATPVMFYCGSIFIKNAFSGIKNRTLNMDTLIVLGSGSAYAYSIVMIFMGGEVYFDTSSMIITFILLGRFIETSAKMKATSQLRMLLSLQPEEARVLRDSGEIMIPLKELRKDELIIIKPGEKIPVDGIIEDGMADIDESMLTGEPLPVFKSKDSKVYAGTINLNGRLKVRVVSVSDTVLTKIMRALTDAQAKKAKIQNLADRVVGWFVPFIIVISIITYLFWHLNTHDIKIALMNSVSVLVIACPCALGLATPLAIVIGTTMLYKIGIIIKDPSILEIASDVNTICFDKTGTITEGKPHLMRIINYARLEDEEIHRIAASLEMGSEHPIAMAIVKSLRNNNLYPIGEFNAIPGMGVKGIINGRSVLMGNKRLLDDLNVIIGEKEIDDYRDYSEKGYTVTGLAIDGALMAWFIISDKIKEGADGVIERLHAKSKEIILLTGDNTRSALEIGKMIGIKEIYADLLPHEKSEIIKKLKSEGKKVIMVGDGINDALSLQEADAGIATGGATDIAVESAKVVIMKRDLRLIEILFEVSKKTYSLIKQNLFWAFSYNLVAIPIAVTGNIHPIVSAISMVISSLIVTGNSLRLLRLKKLSFHGVQ